MTKLTTLIVDDEPLALSLLKSKLAKHANVEIVGECKNGREALSAVLELNPTLIFLDIQMPGINGLEVVKRLQSDIMPLIVFTTAYEQYALDAFDLHAVDYILKPLDDERIERAIARAKERLQSAQFDSQKGRVLSAIDAIDEHVKQPAARNVQSAVFPNHQIDAKVVIKDRDEITIIKQEEIEWIDAAGDYCCIHANGETHIKRSTLKDLIAELDPNMFKRVHRSTIVNLNYINKIIPHTKGEFFLQIGEFERIKVSRNYKDSIKSFISDGKVTA